MSEIIKPFEIVDQFFKTIKSNFDTQSDFAKNLGITKSALSNWKKEGEITKYIQPEIAKRLNSPEFSAMVANYLLGVPTASSDKDLFNTDLAQVVHLFNEEKRKEQIKQPFMEALVHKTKKPKDKEIAMEAVLMFQEEAGLETQAAALTIEEFGITDKELKRYKEKKTVNAVLRMDFMR